MSETRHDDLVGLVEIMTPRERSDHEAGHYVMLRALKVRHITNFISADAAIGNGAIGGICSWTPPGYFSREADIVQSLGGYFAQLEGLYQRRENDPERATIAWQGASDDFSYLLDRHQEHIVASFTETTILLVRQNWGLIEALSDELNKNRILYNDEPRLILDFAESGDPAHIETLNFYRQNRIEDQTETDVYRSFRKRHPTRAWFESVIACFVRLGEPLPQVLKTRRPEV